MPFDIEMGLAIVAAILLLPMLARGNRRKPFARRRRDADRSTEAVIKYLRAHFDP